MREELHDAMRKLYAISDSELAQNIHSARMVEAEMPEVIGLSCSITAIKATLLCELLRRVDQRREH